MIPALALAAGLAAAEDLPGDLFDEYANERQSTASYQPSTVSRAPATVRVVTAEDLRVMGTRNVWDALRNVPGVEVMATRTAHAEVAIRGMNRPLANRMLVMLDGRTVLSGYFDNAFWEEIPVAIEEIERIEIVQGPVSSLYGANAVGGVINIITKEPDRLDGGAASYAGGERNFHSLSGAYGRRRSGFAWKASGVLDTVNRFEAPRTRAGRSARAHGAAEWELADGRRAGFSGGIADLDAQLTTGNNGLVTADGPVGFLRADAGGGGAVARVFWNRSREVGRGLLLFQGLDPVFSYDIVEARAQQEFELPGRHLAVAGASWRMNAARSEVFAPGLRRQDLWAVFAEDEWTPAETWKLVASGRLDRHPLTGWVGSPRLAALVEPLPGQVFRASTGTSFRNPTLMEAYLDFTQQFPNPDPGLAAAGVTTIESNLRGNPGLEPERILFEDVSHAGRFGRLRTTMTGFHYELLDSVGTTDPAGGVVAGTAYRTVNTYANTERIDAWGGEAEVEAMLSLFTVAFANASYERLRSERGYWDRESPSWKANTGLRWMPKGLTLACWGNWVDAMAWNASQPRDPRRYLGQSSYLLLNAAATWTLPGALRGWDLGLTAHNLLDDRHAEVLPAQSAVEPGQGGEVLGRRIMGTLSCRF